MTTTEIIAAINAAAARWTGLDWDSDLDAVADLLAAGQPADGEGLRSWYGAGRPADEDAQRHHARVARLAEALDSDAPDYAALAAEARELAAEEARDVEEAAERAADHGRLAAEYIAAGDLDEALDHLRRAARIEREYGDAPVWGGLAEQVEALRRDAESADAEAE